MREDYDIRRDGTIIRLDGEEIPTFINKDGYVEVKISLNAKNRKSTYLLHYVIASEFIDTPTCKDLTNLIHRNGNKLDNRVENLKWVTSNVARIYANR